MKTRQRVLQGIVVSNKMDKTIVVQVTRIKTHPILKKRYTNFKRFKAHDEKNAAQIGDEVAIVECRPISKDKSYRLQKIISTRVS